MTGTIGTSGIGTRLAHRFFQHNSGQVIWLDEYVLSYGDRIRYDVSAGAGDCMQVGFAKPGVGPQDAACYSVTSRRTDEGLRCSANILFEGSSTVQPGRYQMFPLAPEGALANVSGSVSVTPATGR